MKPQKVLFFVLIVIFFLGIIMLIFPKDGIQLGKNFKLQFPTFSEMFSSNNIHYADIDSLVGKQEQIDSLMSLLEADTIPMDAEELKKLLRRIELPPNNADVLKPFFENLVKVKSTKEIIRIIHYGDSQIEGDRITSFFRKKLQSQFGGFGVGLLPAKQPYDYSFSMIQNTSANWRRYTVFGSVDTSVHHSRYGALAAFSRFAPVRKDSLSHDSANYSAWIEFSKSNLAYSNTQTFGRFNLYYGNNRKPVKLILSSGENKYDSTTLAPTESMNVYTFNFQQPVSNLKITFKGGDSPDIYAIGLDGNSGVAVDNVAMRGNSGTIFTKLNSAHLKTMYDRLNADLFILQFGGNVMPYVDDEREIADYANFFYSQIVKIKQLRPNAPVIVIGPSDMSTKDKENYVTYPHLEKVRDALKGAAFRAGACYWDMYEAMGGKNSMPSWVSANPPLASKDYVHFSPQGAQVIANMFYNAFILEYNDYVKNLKK